MIVSIVYILVVRDKNYISDIVLVVTAIAIIWYSIETYYLKSVQQKQLTEERRKLYLEMRPFIRLEWSQISSYHPHRNDVWHIKIINEGDGIAVNFSMKFSHDQKLIKRSLIGGKREYLPITEPNYHDFGFNDECKFLAKFGPQNIYEIFITYQDISGVKYSQVFKADESENSKFKLVRWSMPKVFSKISTEMIDIETRH